MYDDSPLNANTLADTVDDCPAAPLSREEFASTLTCHVFGIRYAPPDDAEFHDKSPDELIIARAEAWARR